MEIELEEKDLKAAGAELLTDGRRGLRIHGWEIESHKNSILNSSSLQLWEEKLQTSHLPEMVFGESSLVLKHSKALQCCSGYRPSDLKECVLAIHDSQLNRRGSSLRSVRDKYMQHKYKCVASLASPSEVPAHYFEAIDE